MKRPVASAIAASLGLLACAATEPLLPHPEGMPPEASAAPAPSPTTERLEADSPRKTPSGASFEAPKGWYLTTGNGSIDLDGPERDLTVTLVEATEPDARKAIAAAWEKKQPGFSRKVQREAQRPPRDGWDRVVQITYETSSAESRVVIAVSRRKGTTEYVTLIDGALAAADRRGAQLGAILQSFKAPGVEEESFRGKPARNLDAAVLATLEARAPMSLAKGSLPLPEGPMTSPKGSLPLPRSPMGLSTGSLPLPEGSRTLPNGSMYLPKP